MNVAIAFGITLLLLFGLAFFTKRRFGVLGLALAAGSVLSTLWADSLTPIVAEVGVEFEKPPLFTMVSVILVLLPAVLLLFSGPSYRQMPMRILGAAGFALLATAFLVDPFGSALVLEGDSRMIYGFIETNRGYIITVGILFALFDLLTTKTPRLRDKGKH